MRTNHPLSRWTRAARRATTAARRRDDDGLLPSRLPLPPALERTEVVTVLVDGQEVHAHRGESAATVLAAQGGAALRTTVGGEPRGVFCGIGLCFDCLVVVDGRPNTRACVTPVEEGTQIERQHGPGRFPGPVDLSSTTPPG